MKNLQEHLTEALNEAKKNFKKFKDVNYGDEGEDYYGDKGTVEYMGTAEEMVGWDKSGSLKEGIRDGYIEKDSDAVVCEMEDGSLTGYTYGGDGFQCYK